MDVEEEVQVARFTSQEGNEKIFDENEEEHKTNSLLSFLQNSQHEDQEVEKIENRPKSVMKLTPESPAQAS